MAENIFITVDGIPGEVTRKGHEGKIAGLAYDYEVMANVGSGSGGGAGKPTQSPVTIVKLLDKATPKLFESLVKGKHIKFVLLEFERATAKGKNEIYLVIRLDDVLIVNIHQSTDADEPGEFEEVAFSAGKIRTEHKPSGNVVEWDWKTMK
ncbi:MAG: Hcp family type VI secretion system effector [Anaerolineales bacterium]